VNINKKILIDATGGSEWIGGLYYKKNILYSLLQNNYITGKYSFVVFSEKENKTIFDSFLKDIIYIDARGKSEKDRTMELLCYALKYRCKYIFPCGHLKFKRFGITPIHWIADFQHNRMPYNFSEEDNRARTSVYLQFAKDDFPLVLSSQSAWNDFREYYSDTRGYVYVVPFVSYIEDTLHHLSPFDEISILRKFNLEGKKYVCVMNQFWRHKNHHIVLRAMQLYFSTNQNSDFVFVFTGKMFDYRDPEYITNLKTMFEDPIIKEHALLLGFVDRIEQIAVMKNAQFVIQPSLFEGWGTVVEDAKVLDKTILLSDIPVHREQRNDKCRLFDPYDPEMLVSIIKEETVKEHVDDVERGISDMHKRAKEYSKGFEQLLKDQDRKKYER